MITKACIFIGRKENYIQACTKKQCNILRVKNALVNSVYYASGSTTCNRVCYWRSNCSVNTPKVKSHKMFCFAYR
jgi:hypothetical protein